MPSATYTVDTCCRRDDLLERSQLQHESAASEGKSYIDIIGLVYTKLVL